MKSFIKLQGDEGEVITVFLKDKEAGDYKETISVFFRDSTNGELYLNHKLIMERDIEYLIVRYITPYIDSEDDLNDIWHHILDYEFKQKTLIRYIFEKTNISKYILTEYLFWCADFSSVEEDREVLFSYFRNPKSLTRLKEIDIDLLYQYNIFDYNKKFIEEIKKEFKKVFPE